MNLYFDFPNRHLTENLILPGNEKGLEIEWKSSNPAFLSDDGIVKRPEAGQKDEKVILTAKIKGKRQRGQPSQLKYSFLVLAKPLVQPLEEFSLDEVKLLDDYYLKVEKKVVDFLNSFNISVLSYSLSPRKKNTALIQKIPRFTRFNPGTLPSETLQRNETADAIRTITTLTPIPKMPPSPESPPELPP